MATGASNLECGNPAVCDVKFGELERRVKDLEEDDFKEKLWTAVRGIESTVSNLNGRVAGYLVAGGLLGSVVGALSAIVVQLAMAKR